MIKNNDFLNTLVIAFVMTITSLIGLLYSQYYDAAAPIWPAAGFYIAFYILYGKKSLLGILLGLFITNFIFRLFSTGELFYESFVIACFAVFGNYLEIILFSKLINIFHVNIKRLLAFKEIFKFILVAFISSYIGSIVGVVGIMIYFGMENIHLIYLQWATANLVGMLIFGMLIINSHYHDLPFKWSLEKVIQSTIYITIFIGVSIVSFGGYINYMSLMSYQIVFVLLYIITSFVFSFKMIIFNNLVFFVTCNILYIRDFSGSSLANEAIKISIFIIILSSISSLVQMILIDRKNKFMELDYAHDLLEKMILSTNEMFNIKDKLPEDAEKFSLQYFKEMFNLACNIYPKFDRASCYIKGDKFVEFVCAFDYDLDFLNSLDFDSNFFSWELKEPEIVYNTSNDGAFFNVKQFDMYNKEYGTIRESIRLTAYIGDEIIGGMSFDILDERQEKFTQIDLDNFKSFQNLINSYYNVGVLNSRNNQLKDDIVLSLVRTLELYDSYTGGHSEEVAELSVLLSKKLKLKPDEIRHVYWSSIVHDIGKVGLNQEVLNKKGPLTNGEYNEVKKHTIYGYDILNKSKDLTKIAKTVRHHHEWWNGKGYPDNLRGIDIPYSSQILHVCDAVSAMAKKRVYKDAFTEAEIIKELEAGLGKQFSPKVAKHMIKFIQDGELRNFYKKQLI